MRYLGIEPIRPKVGVFDFTGCEGCELQLANKEESLAAFLGAIEVVNFREISSAASDDYEIALIDGAISRDDEVERIKVIRSRAKLVVALGNATPLVEIVEYVAERGLLSDNKLLNVRRGALKAKVFGQRDELAPGEQRAVDVDL